MWPVQTCGGFRTWTVFLLAATVIVTVRMYVFVCSACSVCRCVAVYVCVWKVSPEASLVTGCWTT